MQLPLDDLADHIEKTMVRPSKRTSRARRIRDERDRVRICIVDRRQRVRFNTRKRVRVDTRKRVRPDLKKNARLDRRKESETSIEQNKTGEEDQA